MKRHLTFSLESDLRGLLRRGTVLGIAAAAAALLAGAPAPRSSYAAGGGPAERLSLASAGFSPGGMIPSRYTCSGRNVSPELRWSDPPRGTRSFTLIVTDPDAPSGTFTHWVAFNLPPGQRDLSEAVPKRGQITIGGVQGSNDFPDENIGYGGPCPPPGSPHHYFFRIYALDVRLPLKPGATRAEVERAMKGHILGQAELMGLYGR